MTVSIEDKLKRLLDIEEIRTLRHRYAYGANIIDGKSGDLKAFAALFAADGTFDVGMGVATGPAEIENMMKALTTQWQCGMHYMLNPIIDIDGDRARGTVSGLFAFTSVESRADLAVEIYSDEYVRTPRGWRFQSVTIRNTFADPAFFAGYADQLKS